jgi:hypothetical protein
VAARLAIDLVHLPPQAAMAAPPPGAASPAAPASKP